MPENAPLIETSRLSLGHFAIDDAQSFSKYRDLKEISRYQSWDAYPLASAQALIKSMAGKTPGELDQWFQYAVRLKSTGELIGDIGFKRRENGPSFDADLGYSLAPEFQGHGYMQEALEGLIAWSRPHLAIRRFVAGVDPRNAASIKLLDAMRFRKEAHHRLSYWYKGEWADDAVYVLFD